MGWWIFKSAKEKYMGQLVKRLDAIERLMDEEREDDMLERIEGRLDKLERLFREPEEPEKLPAPATGDLASTTAMLQGIWSAVPSAVKPFVDKLAKDKTGKTVGEWLEDSRAIQAAQQMIGGAVGAVMQKAKTPEKQTTYYGLLPEEMPQPTQNFQRLTHAKEKEEVSTG
jgi:hypothetical protein